MSKKANKLALVDDSLEELEEDYFGSETTIVTVMNFPVLQEHKPMLSPSHYDIPSAKLDGVNRAVIRDAIQFIPQLDAKMLTQPVLSHTLAVSIVNDWSTAQLQIFPPEAMPGLFILKGNVDLEEVVEDHEEELEEARLKHLLWCQRLVELADNLWTEKPSTRHIAETMRHAVVYLKQERPWLRAPKPADFINCPACTSKVPREAAICMHCRAIVDKEKYSLLTFAGA